MPGHAFLNGTEITLRVVERTDRDCAILGCARNDPAYRHALGFDGPWPRSRVREFVESAVADESSVNLFVCLPDGAGSRSGGTPTDGTRGGESSEDGHTTIGAVNLFDIDDGSGTLSYWLSEPHRGRGYATEAVSLLLGYAFDERGLHRVEAEVFEGNDPSQRLLDRLGFVHEGTARDAHFSGGEYRDTLRFGLLASEWAGRERA